ncbi:MAG TPA: DUF63 family protein [Candidatus Thermoplasmatota archaeon]|nr:DUF63 family protein [Candidatus Thermoplasmatota archaeon]
MGRLDRIRAFYDRHTLAVWAVILAIPVLILVAGLVLAPKTFYDGYVWRDIWGPAVADAHQWSAACLTDEGRVVQGILVEGRASCPQGVAGTPAAEGYTYPSEATYGAILAVSLYLIYTQLFVRRGVRADVGFVFALIPIIALGPLARVLEDANAFCRTGTACDPSFWAYFWISPFEYIQMGFFTVLALLAGLALRDRREAWGPAKQTRVVAGLVAAQVAVILALAWLTRDRLSIPLVPVLPVALVLGGAAGVLAYRHLAHREGGDGGVNPTLLALGLAPAAAALALDLWWMAGNVWSEAAWRGQLYVVPGLVMLAIAGAITLAVYLVGRFGGRKWSTLALYAMPLSVLMLLGHMIDGIATWIATQDPFDMGIPPYGEKHPLSDAFLQLGLGGLGFPLMKFVMIVAIIWLLNREFHREGATDADRNLVGLIQMAIFVLGFAPGVRDVARVVMGI